MFMIIYEKVKYYEDTFIIEPNEHVLICDTDDGVVEEYTFKECLQMSEIPAIRKNLKGILHMPKHLGLVNNGASLEMVYAFEALGGMLKCDVVSVSFSRVLFNDKPLLFAQVSNVFTLKTNKGDLISRIHLQDKCRFGLFAIRYVEGLGKYYRVLFRAVLFQDKSSSTSDIPMYLDRDTGRVALEIGIDALFDVNGLVGINSIAQLNMYTDKRIGESVEPEFELDKSLSAMLKVRGDICF